MTNFKYIIFDIIECSKIKIEELTIYSAEPMRVSSNGLKCYVKYIGEMPECVVSLSTKSVEYSYEEIKPQLDAELWSNKIPF